MQQKPILETCFSPAMLDLYKMENSIVVIIDIFRATSTMCAALDNGATEIIPVDDVQECINLGNATPNSLTAGERNGNIAEGLQFGNSPSVFTKNLIEDKKLILTTTNGTRLLHMCKNAHEIIIGSFLNLDAICQYLIQEKKPVLLACASWKDRFNLEDSLFAGAVYEQVKDSFEMNCDSTRAAAVLYNNAKENLFATIKDSSHFLRLSQFGLQEDMRYCCEINKHNVLIKYDGSSLKKY